MAEITYLMNRDTSGFFTEAKKYFDARADADSTVVDTPPGQPWTLGEVLTDLRMRAKNDEVYPVINLVAHGTGFGAVQFPISAARASDDGGIITLDMLKNAVKRAGSDGFPEVLGAPAVTATTKVCFYGCDVGRDQQFMSLFGQLFGPEVTVYAPLRMAVFRSAGGTSEYRLARSWSTAYPKDVRQGTLTAAARTDLGNRLKARFPAASADITAALATATPELKSTYLWSGRMDLSFDGAGTPATADPPIKVGSAVLPAGTVDDTTVALTLTAPDFVKSGDHWTAWVATLGQVLEDPVSLENPAQYRKTVITNGTRAARAALVPDRDPQPVDPAVVDPDPEPDPLEDPMKFFGKYRGVVVDDLGQGRLKVNVPSVVPTDLVADGCLPPVPKGLLVWPAVGDTVFVEFEGGDPEHPIWNGTLAPVQDPLELELSSQVKLTLRAMTVEVDGGGNVDLVAPLCNVRSAILHADGMLQCETLAATSVVSASYTPGAGNIW